MIDSENARGRVLCSTLGPGRDIAMPDAIFFGLLDEVRFDVVVIKKVASLR